MSRTRLVPLALGLTLLLALVAIAARGRPLGSSPGHGGLPGSFWDYTFTTIIIFGAPIMLVAVVAPFFVRKRRGHGASFQDHMLVSIALLTLGVIVGFFIFKHHWQPHFRLREAQQGVPGPGKPGHGSHVTRSRTPGFRWDELAVILGLLLVSAAIAAMRRSRRAPRKRPETAPETLAAALDDSIDDLRGDPDLRRAIIAAYARMERVLAAAGIPRHPAEAPLEYLERALLSMDTSAGAVRRLTDLFEWARFSQHEPEPSMRDDAVDALVAVRDELRASEPAPA
jgi:hypothetical protein